MEEKSLPRRRRGAPVRVEFEGKDELRDVTSLE
ncbi:unnamed protein product [Lathyrus oleraceus]